MDALKPKPPPPKKSTFRGCKLSCSSLPAKKYTEKDIGSRLLRVTFNRRKNNNKDETKYTKGSDSEKLEKYKVRIAQVSLYTERPAEFTAESSDSENPKGNEDILFQTWCEPENDGRGT